MSGKLFAIGTGPGSSDLITVRAARLLANLDVLYAPAGRKGGDSLALSIVREYLTGHVVIKERHFPMSTHEDEKESIWDTVAEEIRQDVNAGKQVGFITLGDAMLFSTWVFLLERLQGRIPLEVIPGVTSFACIASRAVFPLAMEQQTMAVVSCTAPEAELEQALQQHDCIVMMKVYGRFGQIKALLARHHLLPNALLMSEASLPNEQCFRQLQDIGDDVALPYFSTILVNKQWLAAEPQTL
ncbi:cobalt-factor II C(20)-methyltransferase [Tolumonas auensis]|uniref:cobalt-factor II C(20)-methyltransferase n=1 Tax=Tolumonas auensis TaxID=43948 RepID=UPI002AA874ED|nr:cobalt-factor II C(20)-methyltransferase [Tolumonas auensis]